MIRPAIVSIAVMVWCIGFTAPEVPPEPDLVPAKCAPVWVEPGSYDAVLYAAAGRAGQPRVVRDAIAQDDLAALRYLIRVVRRPGVQRGLALPTRSRPLLHALNALTTQPDRARLSEAWLTALHTHYGPEAALAVALARRQSRPDPVLARLLEHDGTTSLGLTHLQRCDELTRAPTLKAQCGQPKVRYELPHRDGGGQPVFWPTWGERRLPGCESDAALADRLLARLPEWRADAAAYADPDWQACYAGLVQHLAQRNDERMNQALLDAVHPRAPRVRQRRWHQVAHVRDSSRRRWSRWTFEHALLALSRRDAHYAKMICQCLSFTPHLVDVYPPMAPRSL